MSKREIFRPIVIARRNERRMSSVPARLISPPVRATLLVSLLLLGIGALLAASTHVPVYAHTRATAVDASRRIVRIDLTCGIRPGANVIIVAAGAQRPTKGMITAVDHGVVFARLADELPRSTRYDAHVEIGSTSLLDDLLATHR
jgi:hypothetical protein